MSTNPTAFASVRLSAAEELVPELARFYENLGLAPAESEPGDVALRVGETVLAFRPSSGTPFYHVALLVPGDRFDAALVWLRQLAPVLPDSETGEEVFDFDNWDALAVYFHDPAGSIIELIAHRGIGEAGATGPFAASELLGLSEVGIVCDPAALAGSLRRELGLELWDGNVESEGRLGFVGEKGRTLVLAPEGRPWLPTGRPAEAHPVEVVLAGAPTGEVAFAGGFVRR